jgi:hypothetical protein
LTRGRGRVSPGPLVTRLGDMARLEARRLTTLRACVDIVRDRPVDWRGSLRNLMPCP